MSFKDQSEESKQSNIQESLENLSMDSAQEKGEQETELTQNGIESNNHTNESTPEFKVLLIIGLILQIIISIILPTVGLVFSIITLALFFKSAMAPLPESRKWLEQLIDDLMFEKNNLYTATLLSQAICLGISISGLFNLGFLAFTAITATSAIVGMAVSNKYFNHLLVYQILHNLKHDLSKSLKLSGIILLSGFFLYYDIYLNSEEYARSQIMDKISHMDVETNRDIIFKFLTENLERNPEISIAAGAKLFSTSKGAKFLEEQLATNSALPLQDSTIMNLAFIQHVIANKEPEKHREFILKVMKSKNHKDRKFWYTYLLRYYDQSYIDQIVLSNSLQSFSDFSTNDSSFLDQIGTINTTNPILYYYINYQLKANEYADQDSRSDYYSNYLKFIIKLVAKLNSDAAEPLKLNYDILDELVTTKESYYRLKPEAPQQPVYNAPEFQRPPYTGSMYISGQNIRFDGNGVIVYTSSGNYFLIKDAVKNGSRNLNGYIQATGDIVFMEDGYGRGVSVYTAYLSSKSRYYQDQADYQEELAKAQRNYAAAVNSAQYYYEEDYKRYLEKLAKYNGEMKKKTELANAVPVLTEKFVLSADDIDAIQAAIGFSRGFGLSPKAIEYNYGRPAKIEKNKAGELIYAYAMEENLTEYYFFSENVCKQRVFSSKHEKPADLENAFKFFENGLLNAGFIKKENNDSSCLFENEELQVYMEKRLRGDMYEVYQVWRPLKISNI